MTISGIGGYGFSPYIYNTNAVSRQSMNKISAISDDMSKSKVDYSNLVSNESEQNPLKIGESKNFVDIIASQMALGSFQKDRLAQSVADNSYNFNNSGNYQMNRAVDAYSNAMNLYA